MRYPGSPASWWTWLGLLLATPLLISTSASTGRRLSFEERVAAQAAIERVYYSHQIGNRATFEVAVPKEFLEKKVLVYLKESAALEDFWHTPVTGKMLQAELARIARDTRFPRRLLEVYKALRYDSVLVQECFVRPILVDRLSHEFFRSDGRIHGRAQDEARALRDSLSHGETVDSGLSRANATVFRFVLSKNDAANAFDADEDGTQTIAVSDERLAEERALLPPHAGDIGPVHEDQESFSFEILLAAQPDGLRVARYRVPKVSWEEWFDDVWSHLEEGRIGTVAVDVPLPAPGSAGSGEISGASAFPENGSVCVPDDTWDNGDLGRIPEKRALPTAVWTGSEMIVWGGSHTAEVFDSGGRYNPLTDTWTPTSRIGAPTPRRGHTAVWTGTEMLIWGGYDPLVTVNTGGRYDPVTDSWRPLSTVSAPASRGDHTAVWTGTVMLVWGGATSATLLASGGIYDPASDSWTPMSETGAPSGRSYHTAVWTGSRMVVWGGSDQNGAQNTGAIYDPASDTWSPTSPSGAPVPRARHTAVWDGTRMLIWGGDGTGASRSGGRFDPVQNSWSDIATANAPRRSFLHTAVWTGSRMLVWGFDDTFFPSIDSSQGSYDPVTDTWAPILNGSPVSPRQLHVAVWTGSHMIIWGGSVPNGNYLNSGIRYDPAADSWNPTSLGNGPGERSYHTAVWTGNQMIVWGGLSSFASLPPPELDSGARYDPLADTWVSMARYPSGRYAHTAVWTGRVMVIWGGAGSGIDIRSGGRYDPISDTWTPTATVNAPAGRDRHSAVWTGGQMIVWGGYGLLEQRTLDTGGRYDPVTDAWLPTSTVNAPAPRENHAAVWTGSDMIVWGGSKLATGARYSPVSDAWSPISSVNAPGSKSIARAIWTGSRMIVCCGSGVDAGGIYDVASDSWTPVSTVGAPAGHLPDTAVWTGEEMIAWTGPDINSNPVGPLVVRYSPLSDSWTPVSNDGAPLTRYRTKLTPVWAGGMMLVWGGQVGGSYYFLNTGGRYFLGHSADHDTDGYRVCDGDCDDRSGVVHPGQTELCDHQDNNCNGLVDESFLDADGDGWAECAGDCDDRRSFVHPGGLQICDGVNNDCNDPAWPATSPLDTDLDGDGFPPCAGDCDDNDRCRMPAQICDGFNNDCTSPAIPANEVDNDGDRFIECSSFVPGCDPSGLIVGGQDCDDSNPSTYPNAPETNDALDNQCPGFFGFGVIDEVSGDAGFHNPANRDEYSWPPQALATRYETLRSRAPSFPDHCVHSLTTGNVWVDPDAPASGSAYYYLVRAVQPNKGSWGQDSSGRERSGGCF